MRILILANNDIGLFKFRKELIQELIFRGNQIYISLPKGGFIEPLVKMGCTFIDTEVDRRGINPIKDLKLLTSYLKIITNIKPEIVITYTIKPNIYGGMICRFTKTRYVANITGLGTTFQNDNLLKKIIVFLYRRSLKKADTVFFENEENQEIFINNQIVERESTCKLNGAGVNIDEYQFCEYPHQGNALHFLFVGRVMKEKGIVELLEAARKIRDNYDNVIFDIVGPIEENDKDIMKTMSEQKNIKYHGYQSDIKPFIEKTHCFILPSHHEGMANTLLESGAMGRPLITSNISGCREAVLDEKSGLLVNVKDSDDLYMKIKQFIDLPYNTKKDIGKKSRDYIEQKFDRRIVIADTMKQLERKSIKHS